MPAQKPSKICGNCNSGYALDLHTIKSDFFGYTATARAWITLKGRFGLMKDFSPVTGS